MQYQTWRSDPPLGHVFTGNPARGMNFNRRDPPMNAFGEEPAKDGGECVGVGHVAAGSKHFLAQSISTRWLGVAAVKLRQVESITHLNYCAQVSCRLSCAIDQHPMGYAAVAVRRLLGPAVFDQVLTSDTQIPKALDQRSTSLQTVKDQRVTRNRPTSNQSDQCLTGT
jgi:hypothetical protein